MRGDKEEKGIGGGVWEEGEEEAVDDDWIQLQHLVFWALLNYRRNLNRPTASF
jgi:hypothetical protein